MSKQQTSSHNERSCRRLGGRVPIRRLLALLVAVLAGTAGFGLRYVGVLAAVAPGSVIRNGGLEEPYVDGIAVPWLNNSWGDAAVSFSRDRSDPHSGRSAQRIHCESVTNGAAQIRQLGIAVRAGQAYTLTVWLRGSVDAPVFVGIRENEAPYHRYLAQSVRVSPEWHRYVITGTPSEDGPGAGLYIAFTVPGDLWLDDVELREGGPAPEPAHVASALPEHKGNLLYNSGFELGPDGWGPVGRLRTDTEDAAQGHACARCTPSWEPILLESRPVVIQPGQRYTISASLRASGPAEVEMVAMEYTDEGSDTPGQRDAIRQTFPIDRQWRRVSLSGVLQAPLVNGYVLQLNLRSGARTVWADAIQWEEGGLTPYQPAAPVEVAVRAADQLLVPGQRIATECQVYLTPKAQAAAPVTYRLEDGDGRRIAERTLRYSLTRPTPGAAAPESRPDLQTAHLYWRLPRPGIYRVVATPPGTPIGRTGQAILCCFPGTPPQNPAPRIGIHAASDPSSPNKAIKAAAYLGAGGFRLHDFGSFVQWFAAEPSPGQFVWFDRDVDDLARRDYRLLGTLCRTPLWAAQPGERHQRHGNWSSSPPKDWDAWSRYVEAVVLHYHDHIHEWEVWNEPWDAEFWTGTPGEYAQLLAYGRRAIKKADPRALVVGGCFSPGVSHFTQSVLQAGGLDSMDVVSYHEYMSPAVMADRADGQAPAFYQAAVDLEQNIQRYGGQQPLWCTETGVPCPSFYSWLPAQGPRFSSRVAVATLVKGLTLAFAAGVERVYYYHVGQSEGGSGCPSRMLNAGYSLLDYDGSPKPTLPALAEATAMLGDATEPSDLSSPSLRAYAFRHKGGYVAVAWARGGAAPTPAPLALAGPAAPAARDVMGAPLPSPVTIGDQPIYLVAETREALARALGSDQGQGVAAR
jgi:glycosyl hydrolase family 39 (putative alpha-L-iduronidase)/carbohydrate binding protein with CBM4/9 domain